MAADHHSTLETTRPRAECAFCLRQKLMNILTESDSFFLLADHAPLIEGHLLLVPKTHYPCYGALDAKLEEEFLRMKTSATEFLTRTYRPPVFWEHGVFHQTVYHAHLHCFPFGPLQLDLSTFHPHSIGSLAEIRAWYEQRGQYFYFERQPGEGQLFAPEEMRYFSVLGELRKQAATHGTWHPPLQRQLNGQPKIQALVQKWQEFARDRQVVNTESPQPQVKAEHQGDDSDGN